MPITWRVNANRGRVDIAFSDPYTALESEKVMREIFAQPGLTHPLRFLVDVRQSAAPDPDFVVNAITFWQLHVAEMWGAKVAVLVATASQVAMANMSERSVESRELPFTVRVFHESESDDAEQWLEQAK